GAGVAPSRSRGSKEAGQSAPGRLSPPVVHPDRLPGRHGGGHIRHWRFRRGRATAHRGIWAEPVPGAGLWPGHDYSRHIRCAAYLCAARAGRLADGPAHGHRQHCPGSSRSEARLSPARSAAQAYICLYAVGDHGSVVAQSSMTAFLSCLRMGLQALRPDWRAGELRLLLLALLVAVEAITSVGFLADRAVQVLERDAAQMLGGDIVLRSAQPLPEQFDTEAIGRG